MSTHQDPTRKHLTIQQLYRGLDNYLATEQRDAFDASASLERLTALMGEAMEVGQETPDANQTQPAQRPADEPVRSHEAAMNRVADPIGRSASSPSFEFYCAADRHFYDVEGSGRDDPDSPICRGVNSYCRTRVMTVHTRQ